MLRSYCICQTSLQQLCAAAFYQAKAAVSHITLQSAFDTGMVMRLVAVYIAFSPDVTIRRADPP